MIPVILLGDSGDSQLCRALQGLLRQRCGWHVDGEFFWQANAEVLLLDLPFPASGCRRRTGGAEREL